MRTLKTIIIFIAGILAGNCIEPYRLPNLEGSSVLVVDGLFTTEPGPHFVKLSLSLCPNETTEGSPVTGAALSVIDDQGESVSMIETNPGIYQTSPPSWHVELGRTYTFQARLPDGKSFESDAQKIYSAGTIDSVYALFTKDAITNINDPSLPQDAFLLFVNATGHPGLPNLFRWRWKGTYEIFTHPELTKTLVGCCLVNDPLPCSGYDASLVQFQPCTCCTCWVNEFSRQARVSGNQFFSDNLFRGVNLTKIPVDGLRFHNKYYIEVEQLSLDESSYSFWKLVQAQQAGATDIFQPNVVRIQGNVSNVDNPNEKALGVVSFASVTRKSIFIHRSEILSAKPSLPILIMDCSDYDDTSTTTKPFFW